MQDPSFSQPAQSPFADKRMLFMLAGGGLLVLFFVVLMIFSFSPQQSSKKTQVTTTPTPVKPINDVYKIEPGKTKLSETEYGPYAYNVFPQNLSSENQSKLKYFKVSKSPNSDGSTKITVTILAEGYTPFSINAPSGTQAYLVVKDPDGDFGENFLVLTDANGNIIEH